jgi:glutathione peroxidase
MITATNSYLYNLGKNQMTTKLLGAMFVFHAMLILLSHSSRAGDVSPKSVLDFTARSIDGKDIRLSKYKGKVLLIVNVASECGNTPQYRDLEALYKRYKDKGFAILAFPANNFGNQEPGTDKEIKAFCETTYHVTFDMFSKISVRGADQHPLYQFITSKTTNPKYSGAVQWNFQKYLIDRHGALAGKYAPGVEPLSKELVTAIEIVLREPFREMPAQKSP